MEGGHKSVDFEGKTVARINLSLDLVREVEESLFGRCLVGLMFGPIKQLRKWMEEKWQPMDVMVEDV